MSAEKRTTKAPPKKRKTASKKGKVKRSSKRAAAPTRAQAEAKPTPKRKKQKKRTPARKRRVAVKSSRAESSSTGAKSKPILHTRICEMFGIQYPIIQTGMGWVSGASLTSATSQAGGLGILAAATMTFRELQEAIAKVKSRTGKPFGVNMRADQSEAAWSVIAPILEVWESVKSTDFPNYPAGSWGPEEADILIAQDGNTWVMPVLLQCREDIAVCGVTTELES